MAACGGYGFWFSDDFDLRWPFGKFHWDLGPVVPRLACYLLCAFPIVFTHSGCIEVVQLYRHRHVPFAHGPRKYSFWTASIEDTKLAPGMLAGWAMSGGGWGLYIAYTFWFLDFLYYSESSTLGVACKASL